MRRFSFSFPIKNGLRLSVAGFVNRRRLPLNRPRPTRGRRQLTFNECRLADSRQRLFAGWGSAEVPAYQRRAIYLVWHQQQPACNQGCIRRAYNRRRRGVPLPLGPPPGPRFHSGKQRNSRKEILIWTIFGTQNFGSQDPPPPSCLLIHPCKLSPTCFASLQCYCMNCFEIYVCE